MAQDTYQEVWNKVLLRCPSLSPKLSQDFVVNAFRRLFEIRRWSWLVKFGQFIAPNAYNTGLVNVTNNSTIIIGVGTNWNATLVGQQFRVGLASPIYTITAFDSPTQIEIDLPFGGPTSANASYSIYQCYFTPPNDFHQFITLWDPAFNWQLYLDVQQQEINIWDAQRANTGNVYVVSFRGYTQSQVGVVQQPLQITGTGAAPVAGGIYTGPSDALFTVTITLGGVSGTAQFSWSKQGGGSASGVVTDPNGYPQALMDGVYVSFPTGQTYDLNDIFIVQTGAIANPGLPFYELWPHQQAQHVYPFLYECRPKDLDDFNAVIPNYIRGDVLMEMALEDVALWPGVSADKPNPYYSLSAAKYHHDRLQNDRGTGFIDVLEVQDDNVYEQNLSYLYPAMAWQMATPLGDAAWLQSHAI